MCQLPADSLVYKIALFKAIYNGLGGVFPASLCWLDFALTGVILGLIVITVVMLGTALYVWTERRLLGRFQTRLGPNRWGPFGLFQPFADVLKLLMKEDLIPTVADRVVFTVAPVIMLAQLLLVMVVVPLAKNTVVADLNVGLLYFIAISGLGTLAIFMGGWSSGNRYAMFGAMRGVAQLLSYEIPVVIALVSVALVAGSMSFLHIADSQKGIAYILVLPLAFFIYLVGASAEMNRSPFDIVEAESELVSGYHTEYSGAKFALFMSTEFGAVLVHSAIIASLFLGGWSGPFLSGQLGALWLLLKVMVVAFVFIWIRATLPRLRIDQIMAFAWKGLFPLSIFNLLVVGLELYFLRDPATGTLSTADLWLMAVINLGILALSVAWLSRVVEPQVRKPPVQLPGGIVGEEAAG